MSTTTNLGITKLEVGQAQKEATINTAFDTFDSLFGAGSSAWTSWTPSWTNLTLDNGTVVAKYAQIGKTVICRLSLVFGSGTSVSGLIEFTLPVTRAANAGTAGLTPMGGADFYDSSITTTFRGGIGNFSTTKGHFYASTVSGSNVIASATSATVPFTWTTSDEIATQFVYEAA